MPAPPGRGHLVGVVLHEAAIGGASRSVLGAIPLLEERGWRFEFWAPGPGEAHDELRERGYAVAGGPRLLRYGLRTLAEPPGPRVRLASTVSYMRAFRRWADARRIDVLHANTLITLPELLVAHARVGATLSHVHEMLPADARGRAAAMLLRRASHVAGCSTACVAALEAAGVEASVVHEGVRLPDPPPSRRTGSGRIVVGTAGTISRRKGSDLFVSAARKVTARDPSIEFRMAGGLARGPEEAWARAVLEDAGRAGIRYLGHTDMRRELAEWSVFVLAPRADPFPLAVLEAMAAEVPVVGASVDGVAEQLGPGTGVLVPREDPRSLSEAILTMARLPGAAREEMGRAARSRVASHFTVEHQAEALHRAYLAALRGERR